MNEEFTNHLTLLFNRDVVCRAVAVLVTICTSCFFVAATLGANPVVRVPQNTNAIGLATSDGRPVLQPYKECIALLWKMEHVNPMLVEAVSSLLNDPSDSLQIEPQQSPSVMVVTYREQAGQVRDVIVQLSFGPEGSAIAAPNLDGYVRAGFEDGLSQSIDRLFELMSHQVVYLGSKEGVKRERRAFQTAMSGDVSLLREETVDPLHILIVIPQGGVFLPHGLRSRVRSVIVDAELAFGTWQGQLQMVTESPPMAEEVAGIIDTWRVLAAGLPDKTDDRSPCETLRGSLKSSVIRKSNNLAIVSVSVDAQTFLRVSKEITARGGGCPSGDACPWDKVAVCHKLDSKHYQTLCVAQSEVTAYLVNGDFCGPCSGDGDKIGNDKHGEDVIQIKKE